MRKRALKYICMGLFLLGTCSSAQAQAQAIKDKIDQALAPRDPLKEIFDKVTNMEKEYTDEQKGISKNMAQILATLKDPFIPQLPKPQEETPQKDTPPPDEPPKLEIFTDTDEPEKPRPKIRKPDFEISGMVWNTDHPQAIMDDEIINIGDRLGQWTIEQIGPAGVEIIYKDTKFIIEP